MKNKKSAGFKMKKSPNKFGAGIAVAAGRNMRSQAKIDPRYYMPGGPGEGKPIPSDTGGPSRPNPYGRPRGLFGGMADIVGQSYFGSRPKGTSNVTNPNVGSIESSGRPKGLFGGGPRRPRPNLYGRPKRGGSIYDIINRLRGKIPTRPEPRPNPYAGSGGGMKDWLGGGGKQNWMDEAGISRKDQMTGNYRPGPEKMAEILAAQQERARSTGMPQGQIFSGDERKPTGWSIEGKPTYGPAFPGARTMSAMAKKSGFTMKKGSKPNKSEFFKGKK